MTDTATVPATTVYGVRIDGVPQEPSTAQRWAVTEPATGDTVAELVCGGRAEAETALRTTAREFSGWAETPNFRRAAALREIATELRESTNAESMAVSISRETGKRISESRAEVELSARFFDWFAAAISARRGETWAVAPGVEHAVDARPVGIVVVVTPWNFPVSIPARKIAPALAAGCPVLFKPSEVAPTSALMLAEIAEHHLPSGLLATVIGEPDAVVMPWLGDSGVRGLTFTGSTRVGLELAAHTAPRLTRCVLELGGNAPFVVLDDADLDTAAELLAAAKYRNNGQSCIAANQVWVPRARVDAFTDRFASASAQLVLGDPCDEDTTLGPLALSTDADRIAGVVEQAATAGATVFRPDVAVPHAGQFGVPVLCVDPPSDTRIVQEEIFGPAVAIRGYDEMDEVIGATRADRYGLGGYVVGQADHATAVARALDVGIVGVNNASPNTPQIPFGGLKASGIGWEGGDAGLDAFLTKQTVAIAAHAPSPNNRR